MGTHILHRNEARTAPPATASRWFMFPGQSSGGATILSRARRVHPAADQVADRAREVLGEERAAVYLGADEATLRSNRDTQITVFLATQMYLAALQAEGIEAGGSLGLSLGEYSHLVHIGALGFEDALRLVDERGRCYDEAPPGIMATVLAVDRDSVAAVVERARVHGPIAISNINAPTQHVIAGAAAAVTWAAATLEDEHLAHITIIERRVPMHSPMMAPVAQAFAPALQRAPWRVPSRAYQPNVGGAPIANPTASAFVSHLTRHVSEPVLWQHSIDRIVAADPETVLIEVGPGGVLHNMIGRTWRGTPRVRVDAPEGIDPRAHWSATMEALRA
ncbi:MAG: ACP S-malonyltransferase [Cyanobacteria bacterium]|nr:ACP S-malonyltransferase [Cyanobacteriota bacterium]